MPYPAYMLLDLPVVLLADIVVVLAVDIATNNQHLQKVHTDCAATRAFVGFHTVEDAPDGHDAPDGGGSGGGEMDVHVV